MDCYEWWLTERQRQQVLDVFDELIVLVKASGNLAREVELDELKRSFEEIIPSDGDH